MNTNLHGVGKTGLGNWELSEIAKIAKIAKIVNKERDSTPRRAHTFEQYAQRSFSTSRN